MGNSFRGSIKKMLLLRLTLFTFGPLSVLGHGTMLWPPTWYDPNGTIGINVETETLEPVMWFSNWTFIPGVATLDSSLYTIPDFHGDAWHNRGVFYPTNPDRNPWMAPGTARVFSPCGAAGGNPFGCGSTKHEICPGGGYSFGPDARSKNWSDAPFTQWKRGGNEEVWWGILANHGGGYSYRLCKVGEDGPGGVTEDCFQKNPLRFASEDSWAQYGQDKSSRVVFKANRTTKGTYPQGSEWTMNPVPVCNPTIEDWRNCQHDDELEFPPRIEGMSGFGPVDWTLIDEVKVPEGLEPGKYVLSFRWDCEETAQIWNACSNVLLI